MGKNKQPEEELDGAPEWMVTFSDCMTLLLTFFVLLLSYSSFDVAQNRDLSDSLGREDPVATYSNTLEMNPVVSARSQSKTQPSLNESTTPENSQPESSNTSTKKKPIDFRNLKVFTISSNKFFFGSGVQITPLGKKIIKGLYILDRHKAARIVISEFSKKGGDRLSLKRSNTIATLLIEKGVCEDAINISTSCLGGNYEGERTVEITRLERSIYE